MNLQQSHEGGSWSVRMRSTRVDFSSSRALASVSASVTSYASLLSSSMTSSSLLPSPGCFRTSRTLMELESIECRAAAAGRSQSMSPAVPALSGASCLHSQGRDEEAARPAVVCFQFLDLSGLTKISKKSFRSIFPGNSAGKSSRVGPWILIDVFGVAPVSAVSASSPSHVLVALSNQSRLLDDIGR